MHPDPRELVAERERLRELVLVVREHEVEPAAVDLEDGAEASSAIAEHSMCQPGRPRPQGESHEVSSPGLFAFQSAKSRGSSLRGFGSCSSTWSARWPREPAVVREAGDAEVDVAARLVREAGGDQLLDHRDLVGDRLRRRVGSTSGRPSPRSARVLEVPVASRGAASSALAPGRGVVDLVVDVGDVVRRASSRSRGARSQRSSQIGRTLTARALPTWMRR